MFCKRCGAALPSHGFICPKCGAMMSSDQIKKQKDFNKDEKNITLLSDLYSKDPIKRDYTKVKESKFLGAILIVVILIILIVLALLKVM